MIHNWIAPWTFSPAPLVAGADMPLLGSVQWERENGLQTWYLVWKEPTLVRRVRAGKTLRRIVLRLGRMVANPAPVQPRQPAFVRRLVVGEPSSANAQLAERGV